MRAALTSSHKVRLLCAAMIPCSTAEAPRRCDIAESSSFWAAADHLYISAWATRVDVGMSKDLCLAAQGTSFMASTGVSTRRKLASGTESGPQEPGYAPLAHMYMNSGHGYPPHKGAEPQAFIRSRAEVSYPLRCGLVASDRVNMSLSADSADSICVATALPDRRRCDHEGAGASSEVC